MQTPILNTMPSSIEHRISIDAFCETFQSSDYPCPFRSPREHHVALKGHLQRGSRSYHALTWAISVNTLLSQEVLPLTPKEQIITILLLEPFTCFPNSYTALSSSCTRIIVNFRILPDIQRTKAKIKNMNFPYVSENDKALASLYRSFTQIVCLF